MFGNIPVEMEIT